MYWILKDESAWWRFSTRFERGLAEDAAVSFSASCRAGVSNGYDAGSFPGKPRSGSKTGVAAGLQHHTASAHTAGRVEPWSCERTDSSDSPSFFFDCGEIREEVISGNSIGELLFLEHDVPLAICRLWLVFFGSFKGLSLRDVRLTGTVDQLPLESHTCRRRVARPWTLNGDNAYLTTRPPRCPRGRRYA
jgi:hypothetical protein